MGYLRYECSTIPQLHKRLSDFNINLPAQNACHYQNQHKKRQPHARQEKSQGIFQWPCPTTPRLYRYRLGRSGWSYNTDETVAIFSKSLCNKDCKAKVKTGEALTLSRWASLHARRFGRLCCFVQDALKGVIPEHLDVFSSTMSQQHGYNTRNSYMPKVSRPRTEWDRNKTYHKAMNNWTLPPSELKRLMPKTILNTIWNFFYWIILTSSNYF